MTGVSSGTAQKNGIAIREGKSAAGLTSVISSLFPYTLTPLISVAVPAVYSLAPAMSEMNDCAGEFIFLFRSRSMTCLNVIAVTAAPDGGENRNPLRIVKVYVLPPFETAGSDSATSGCSVAPACPVSSG